MKQQTGFSLIEILIALAILSIALTAALLLSSRSSKNILHTQERVMAQWVAENTLAKIQMGSLKLQNGRPLAGSQAELHRLFFYQAVTAMQYPHAVEIHINVGLTADKPLVTIKGWYFHNTEGGES